MITADTGDQNGKTPTGRGSVVRKRITATFTHAQAHTLWTMCDSAMSDRLLDGDRRDAAIWKRLRDKFARPNDQALRSVPKAGVEHE